MLATAADLPPELFDLILDFLPSAVGVRGPPEAKRGKKHMLSLCSLVCKFWASRCRPRLFDSITLRCLADFQTLSSLPAAVRSYIVNLTVEDTKGSVPWTHLVYAFTIQGGLSKDVNLIHTLNGACTPTSVQTLRSLHDSLPRQPPRYIIHCIPLIIRNFRLRSFSDVAQLVRKLPGGMYWHVEFDNVSWITSPGGVPPALGAKNRATCDYAAVKNCEERWPFVWLLVTTRRPQPPSRNELPPGPFLHISEALRLVELVKCITSPTGSKKRLCTNTEFTRSPMSKVIPTRFSLRLSCCDQYSCIPFTTFVCQDGSLNCIRMEFNPDPEQGDLPLDFDWVRFDTVCSLSHALEAVELRIDGTETEAAEFGQSMLRRMRSLARTNKLRFPYYDTTEYKNKTWVDPIGLEEQSTDTA